MAALPVALRGLWSRRGLTVSIFMVAVVAAAAATVGPVYYAAAGTSILQDTLRRAAAQGQGVDVFVTGQPLTSSSLDGLGGAVGQVLAGQPAARLFGPPIKALEFTGSLPGQQSVTMAVWRDGACAHLTFTAGRCPHAAGEVVASVQLATKQHWRLGQRLTLSVLTDTAGRPVPLTLVGTYRAVDPTGQFWMGRDYFLGQFGPPPTLNGPSYTDALFTAESTFAGVGPTVTGTAVWDLPLRLNQVTFPDIASLRALIARLTGSLGQPPSSATPVSLAMADARAATTLPQVLSAASTSRNALTVPVFVIVAQLLVLCWLLLFLLVTDAAEARGGEVALAKLRGLGRWRSLRFGLAEPVLLLSAALPVGAVVGWAATGALATLLLRAGTPVPLVALGWAAAAVAIVGGLVAAGLAARRTLTRGVVEQWQHTTSRPARRAWVPEAALLALTAAGLVELFVTGTVGSAGTSALALLVPGLVALVLALLAARALPATCRWLARRTNRRGGLARYLALRQVARRRGGARTTIVLVTAFGLAAFAVCAWVVGRGNIHDTAWTQIGAARVLTVTPPASGDLAGVVDRLDPSGTQAATVESYTSDNQTLLAVDPHRFVHVAFWRPDFAPMPLSALAGRLDPPASPPVRLTGDALRVELTAAMPTRADLYAVVHEVGASGDTPLDLGTITHNGSSALTGTLPVCSEHPCLLRSLYLEPNLAAGMPGVPASPIDAGTVTFTGLAVHDAHGWHPIPAVLTTPGRWVSGNRGITPPDQVSAGPGGLRYRFTAQPDVSPTLVLNDHPTPLPAVVTASLAGADPGAPVSTFGLDGQSLTVAPVAVATALPGGGANAVLVDREYAELAGSGVTFGVQDQVWLAATAPADFADRLRAAGVAVLSTDTASATAAEYRRQGPALALVLFLAAAAAAAAIAIGGAALGLHVAGRRRRYELAALLAVGLQRRTLRRSLLAEEAITLAVGTLIGVGAGVLAAWLTLPSVPEFITPPAGAPPLRYDLPGPALGALIGAALVLLAVTAVASTLALLRTVRLDQLREAPQ